jgi:hypothetical protein
VGQLSNVLRSVEGGHSHWCPGCEQMHVIPDTWMFDGNLEKPTFYPSVRTTGKQQIFVGGKWTGGWKRDAAGEPVDFYCHYFLHAGQLQFCGDSTHALAGRTVPLPPLPGHLTDDDAG